MTEVEEMKHIIACLEDFQKKRPKGLRGREEMVLDIEYWKRQFRRKERVEKDDLAQR